MTMLKQLWRQFMWGQKDPEIMALRSELFKAEVQFRLLIRAYVEKGGSWTRPALEADYREHLLGPNFKFPETIRGIR